MSVCDTCPVPGHCCRFLSLGGGSFAKDAQTIEEAEAVIADHNEHRRPPDSGPLPFRPLMKRGSGDWIFWCPNLNRSTGRCDDYANRPYCCSNYEPGSDRLCVLHKEAA